MASLGEPATETVFEGQLTPLCLLQLVSGIKKPWH